MSDPLCRVKTSRTIDSGASSKSDAATSLFDAPDTPRANRAHLPPFQKHSATSREAAVKIKPERDRQREIVLNVLRQNKLGLTDDQIQVITGLNGSSARPRRIELFAAGLVRPTDETRPTRTGRKATVWVAVEVKL